MILSTRDRAGRHLVSQHGKAKTKSYVVDTNVFLVDPLAIYAFPGSEVVIPDSVLSELDRLKTSKADKRVRYRGRHISRILFSLSEDGMLLEGVPLEDGAVVRVVPLDPKTQVPPTLNPKNSDDRIVAVAHQLAAEPGSNVTLVTNDLNMLLKAQALRLPVMRYGEDEERGLSWRLIQNVKRNRAVSASVLVGVAALALALYALSVSTQRQTQTQSPAFPSQGSTFHAQEFSYLQALSRNPKDVRALVGLGNLYFDEGKATGTAARFRQAIDYYIRALAIDPSDVDVRTDLAIMQFYSGAADLAIREAKTAVRYNPQHAYAHFNLGVFYFKGKKDYVAAVRELRAAIKYDKSGELADQARELLQQIRTEEKQGG